MSEAENFDCIIRHLEAMSMSTEKERRERT
jgi:hypothetical protein